MSGMLAWELAERFAKLKVMILTWKMAKNIFHQQDNRRNGRLFSAW
jgi:hypothetical protein